MDLDSKTPLTEDQKLSNEINIDLQEKDKEEKKSFFKKHWVPIVAIISLIIIGSVIAVFVLQKDKDSINKKQKHTAKVKKKKENIKKEIKYYSNLSGLEVANQDLINKPVTAIMVENSPEARPQSGLNQAEIVFEAIAEGGITRFMALYQTNSPQKIGPVRSVRKYYLDWAKPFNAGISHCGGSQEALAIVRGGSYRDLDQIIYGNSYYWRVNDRRAPHNLYTSKEKLDSLNSKKNYLSSEPKTFIFKDNIKKNKDKTKKEETVTLEKANIINMRISSNTFNTKYVYQPKTNNYLRYLAGKPHVNKEGGNIEPKVVIAMINRFYSQNDAKHHNTIETTGTGNAFIFQDGNVIKGKWSKSSLNEQIHFTDSLGKEIKLNKGQIWITSIPNNAERVTWN